MNEMTSLQRGIQDRQIELRQLVGVLGKKAHRLQILSNSLKVTAIVLAAGSTAKGVADKLVGADNHYSLISFTLIGLITTIVLGVEAAFRLEKRAAELNGLSASCQAAVIKIDSEWRKRIGSGDDNPIMAGRELISVQDAKLAEIHEKAASLGVHVTLEIRELENPEREPYGA